MKDRIGFIGLGIMGKPMACNLLAAGYELVVHNRSAEAVEALIHRGAGGAANPREIAEQSSTIILMLPDGPDVESVMTGKDGVLDGIREGTVVIDMSTISPVVSRRIAGLTGDRGAEFLDAPVSGGDKGAIAGTLSIMVGGAVEAFDRCLPILRAMGRTIVHVGPSGAGQTVKACNQVVVALTFAAISEALVLGSKAGVAPEKIVEVLGGGLAGSRILELKAANMIEHNFTPGFKTRLHHKDLGIALSAARAAGVSLPLTGIVDQMFESLVLQGQGELDHSVLLTLFEYLGNHRLRPASA